MVKCPICGIERKALYKHIHFIHQMSVEDFREKFPKYPTEDKEVIENLHNSQVKRWSKIEEKEKASEVMKKLWKDEEYRSKLSKSRVIGAKKQWMNKELSAVRIESIRKAQTNLWKDETYRSKQIQSFKDKWKNKDYKDKMLNKFTNKKEYIRKDGSSVRMRSTYEVTCSEYLDSLNVEYVYEKHPYTIKNKDNTISHYIPDFYLKKYKCFIEVKSNYYYNRDKSEITYRVNYMKDTFGFNVYIAKEEELESIESFKKFLIKTVVRTH